MWRCASVSQSQMQPNKPPALGLAPFKGGKKIEALTHLKLIAVVLVKRWFPVISCSKFRFLTESSRLLCICNTLLLTYNYSLLTCSKENVHLVLYSGFLYSFYKNLLQLTTSIPLGWRVWGVFTVPRNGSTRPLFIEHISSEAVAKQEMAWADASETSGPDTHTPTHALILFFNSF